MLKRYHFIAELCQFFCLFGVCRLNKKTALCVCVCMCIRFRTSECAVLCCSFFIVKSNELTFFVVSINWISDWWHKCVTQMSCKSIINLIVFILWCSINNTLKGIIFAKNVILTACICNGNNRWIVVGLVFAIVVVCNKRRFIDNFMHWWRRWQRRRHSYGWRRRRWWIWVWMRRCRWWSILCVRHLLLLLGRIKLLYLLELWQLLCWREQRLLIMLWLCKHFARVQWRACMEWLWWILLWQECRRWWLQFSNEQKWEWEREREMCNKITSINVQNEIGCRFHNKSISIAIESQRIDCKSKRIAKTNRNELNRIKTIN